MCDRGPYRRAVGEFLGLDVCAVQNEGEEVPDASVPVDDEGEGRGFGFRRRTLTGFGGRSRVAVQGFAVAVKDVGHSPEPMRLRKRRPSSQIPAPKSLNMGFACWRAATTQRNRGLRVQVEVTNCLRIRFASSTDPSVEQGIDVAGIGFDRQLRKPARHLVDSLPLLADEDQALTQRRTIAAVAERGATLETGARHIALDRREFEREAVGRPRESGQRLRLETLDVDLDESR